MMRSLVNLQAVASIASALVIGSMTTTVDAVDLPLPVAELEHSDAVDFAQEIMPILKRNCLACHHQKESEGGLILESIETIHQGGDTGDAVVAKDVNASLLFVRATGAEEPLMPPEDNSVDAQPLTPHELGLLKRWIEQGARGSDIAASQSIDWQPIPESIRTVYAMDVSPNGQLAALGRGNRVAVIDLATYAEVARLTDPSLTVGAVADVDLIQSIAFSPDAQRVATGGFRTVRIWKKSSRPVDPASTPLLTASGLIAIKSDESVAALVNAIGDIEVWNLADNQKLHTLGGHADQITGLALAADQLYSCDRSGKLIGWQVSTGKRTAEFDVGTALTGLAVSSSSTSVAAIDMQGRTHLFQVSGDGKSIQRISEAAGEISDATAVAFTDKPVPMTIIASKTLGVVMLALADQKVIRKLDHGAVVDALAVSGDQARLVTGGRDGSTRVWNLADGKPLRTMQGDPLVQLKVADARRNAARQKAAVERMNQKTGELEKLLVKENEVLTKATQEHQKATEALAAEEKKRVAAAAVVSATEARISKAGADASKATETISAATKILATSNTASETVAKKIEASKAELSKAQETAAKTQQQIAALTKVLNEAKARAEKIEQEIAEENAARTKAIQEAANAQQQIDSANKIAAEAKAVVDKSTKELEAQKKTVTAAEESKRKSEAELSKRQQALDTATSAQKRASAAIPAHQAIVRSETQRQSFLDQRLTLIQSRLTEPGNEVLGVAVSRDNERIATAHNDGTIRVYRADDGQPISAYQTPHRGDKSRVAFWADLVVGSTVAAPPALFSLQVDWALERTIGSVDDPSIISDRVTALDFRPDAMAIAVGSGPPSRSGEVKVFAVHNGKLVRDFGEVHSDTVLGIKFSPDGRSIASSAADKTIRLLDVSTGKVTRSLEGHTHHVLSIGWQDDGQTLASASADRSVKIWNIETGEQRRTITGFSKEIAAVEFVQSSNQVVAACADGKVRLYDTSNGRAIRTFDASGDFLFTASVTLDGKKLLAGGQSGIVRFWSLADGKLLHELK